LKKKIISIFTLLTMTLSIVSNDLHMVAVKAAENLSQADITADWQFSKQNIKSGSIDTGDLVMQDASGNGNDLELKTTGDANSSEKANIIKWSSLNSENTSTGESLEFNNYKGAPVGIYLSTVSGAPINTEKFTNGYTVEVLYKMPANFDKDKYSWMGILGRSGSSRSIGKTAGDPIMTNLAISSIKEVQWDCTPTNLNKDLSNWSFALDNNDTFYHIAVVNDGANTKLYVNGVLDFRNPTDVMNGIDMVTGKGWNVGASEYDNKLDTLLAGNIERIRISNKALTSDQWIANKGNEKAIDGTNEDLPLLTNSQNYNFLFVPDIQFESAYKGDMLKAQMKWIADNYKNKNIKMTSFLGDIVDSSTDAQQWKNATTAISQLNAASVPNIVMAGNHDYGGSNAYLNNFGPQIYTGKDYIKGTSPSGYSTYGIVQAGSYNYMFMSIDMNNFNADLNWANTVLNNNPNIPTIIFSHELYNYSEINKDGTGIVDTDKSKLLWDRLINNYDQIFMTFAGHNHGSVHRVQKNAFGHDVIENLVDYQSSPFGGNAWMRFAEFDENANTINFKTYSPWVEQLAPENKTYFDVKFLTSQRDQYKINFNFKERFNFKTPTFNNNLLLDYKFNETSGTTAIDSSGHNYDGNLVGGATLAAGKSGNAVSLNGTDGYVKIPNGILKGLNNVTITSYVKLAKAVTNSWVYGLGPDSNRYLIMNSKMSSGAGAPRGLISKNTWKDEQAVAGTSALPINEWKHLALVLSGDTNTETLYIDGVKVAQNTNVTVKPSEIYDATKDFSGYIGKSLYNGDPYFSGQVDDFRVYNKALSGSEIQAVINPVILDVAAVDIKTKEGVVPELPTTVKATYNDGAVRNLNVTWDAIDPSKYGAAGNFEVEGTVEGTTIKAKANVSVEVKGKDATLSCIMVNGTELTDFAPDKLEYNIYLPSKATTGSAINVTTMPAITIATTDPNATKKTTEASSIPGVTSIIVTAEDAITKLIYKLNYMYTAISDIVASASAESKKVVVSGNINTGSNKNITIQFLDPQGNVDYVGQTTSSENGMFTFNFTSSKAQQGNYTIKIGGEGITNPYEKTVVFIKEAPKVIAIKPVSDIDVVKGTAAALPKTVTVLYSDGTEKEVAVTWANVDTSVLGTYTIEGTVAGYTGKASVKVNVKEKAVSITSIKPVNSIDVAVGGQVRLPQTVTAVYSDGTEKEVAVTWANIDTSVLGTYTTEGTVAGYTGKVSVKINVKEKAVTITSIKPVNSIDVAVGGQVTLPQTVTAAYSDLSEKEVAVTWGSVDTSVPGTYTIEGTVAGYTGKASVKVNVKEKAVTITSIKPVNSIDAIAGREIILPKTVIAVYSDGTEKEVAVTWANVDTSVPGTYTIEGTVTDYSEKVKVTVTVVRKKHDSSTGNNNGGSTNTANSDNTTNKDDKNTGSSTAPVIDEIGNQNADQGNFIQFKVNASSTNNKNLTYTAENLPAGATFDAATQTLNWTPNVDQAGSYTISFNVTDGITTTKKEVTIVVRNVPAPEEVEKALAEKDFYHFNIAYYKTMKLSDETERVAQLNKLVTIYDLVFNEDIKNINKSLDELAATGSGKIYDEVQALINNANISAVDKAYLLGEVTSWGKKLVFTEEYKNALEALINANNKLDTDSINRAETAIAKITNNYSKDYLLGELAKIKTK
jgi:hypothetical protein